MSNGLSPRLAAVAAKVIQGRPVADVGTDHAKLPAWLVQSGLVPFALAMDVASGPITTAQKATLALVPKIEVRQSDGLDQLADGEADTVTICGMGGGTMTGILSRGLPRLKSVQRVVLQPQSMWADVRSVMLSLGFECTEAQLVSDRSKLYVVEQWDSGQSAIDWTHEDLRWGRLIRQQPDPLYRTWLLKELADVDLGLAKLLRQSREDHPDVGRLRRDRSRIVKECDRLAYSRVR